MARRQVLGSGQVPTSPLIDMKILVIAALVASPAAYRASQGLLTVDEAVTRFLLVAAACIATAVVVRAVWPILAGPMPEKPEQVGAAAPAGDDSSGGASSGSDGFVDVSPQPE